MFVCADDTNDRQSWLCLCVLMTLMTDRAGSVCVCW